MLQQLIELLVPKAPRTLIDLRRDGFEIVWCFTVRSTLSKITGPSGIRLIDCRSDNHNSYTSPIIIDGHVYTPDEHGNYRDKKCVGKIIDIVNAENPTFLRRMMDIIRQSRLMPY